MMSEKDVEIHILEYGEKLTNPRDLAVEELLTLLDGVLICLRKVSSKKETLDPLLKALINPKLCRHSQVEVKLAVGACISEVTRITSPDAPYDGRKMEKAFKLIVSLFKKSSFDKSILSHSEILSKKTSILESLAKVNACVVMIDLECDALINEMIQNFLQDISYYYSQKVFSSMENIMTLIIKESSYRCPDVLSRIIYYVRKDVEVPRQSWTLAEKVLRNCADADRRLEICMRSVVSSIGNYRNIVGWICKEKDEHGCLTVPGVEEEDIEVDLAKEPGGVEEDRECHLTKGCYRKYYQRGHIRENEGEGFKNEIMQAIVEAGNVLIDPPCSVDELLALLDELLICLQAVKSWPAFTKNETLCSLKKALINWKLCRHSQVDVKFAVAACISEVVRIVAPDPPYYGPKMEEAFMLIVSIFEEPPVDKGTPSYSKILDRRTSILESLDKAGVVIDLNSGALNTAMIKIFLKAINNRYPRNAFPYMAKIMTLVLKKRAAIPPEMLLPLLYYVREDVEVPNASRMLAEKVLSNCANRLERCLPEAVRLFGVPIKNYSKIVVSICPQVQEHQLAVNKKKDSQGYFTNENQTRVQAFRSKRSADKTNNVSFRDKESLASKKKEERLSKQCGPSGETYNVSYLFRDEEILPKKTAANKKKEERLSKPCGPSDEKSLNGGDKIVTFALFCFVIYAFTR